MPSYDYFPIVLRGYVAANYELETEQEQTFDEQLSLISTSLTK